MNDYQKYGIDIGQVYVSADGSKETVKVIDVAKYANCGDIVVFDSISKTYRRIDAFKLAMVRYCLIK